MLRAKLTDKHTLYIGEVRHLRKPGDPEWMIFGTWGSWLKDNQGKLVQGSQFEVGFGDDCDDPCKREAYDRSVALLRSMDSTQGLIAFDGLEWLR